MRAFVSVYLFARAFTDPASFSFLSGSSSLLENKELSGVATKLGFICISLSSFETVKVTQKLVSPSN